MITASTVLYLPDGDAVILDLLLLLRRAVSISCFGHLYYEICYVFSVVCMVICNFCQFQKMRYPNTFAANGHCM
jgi:hypothetical protein